MKHLKHYIHPISLNCAIAILAMTCGCFVYNNNENITDFELIIIILSVFTIIKGIMIFVDRMWLR